jgi:F-type H+-transporting ATPase subunit gamma
MPNLRMIRRRISAVQNIQQVTRAMRMIAASRLRRAQESIEQTRPYSDQLDTLIRHIGSLVEQDGHPLVTPRKQKRATIIVITGDRGLCRGFNSNALRLATERHDELTAQGIEVEILAVGRKAAEHFNRRHMSVVKAMPGVFQHLDFQTAVDVAGVASQRYMDGDTDLVEIVYNEFKSVMRQELVARQFLPLEPLPVDDDEQFVDYIYEPDREQIWQSLLGKHLNFAIWRALLESNAAEQAARMTAMEEATNNADDMIKNLISVRNKVRQTSITTEIGEIVGAAEALQSD